MDGSDFDSENLSSIMQTEWFSSLSLFLFGFVADKKKSLKKKHDAMQVNKTTLELKELKQEVNVSLASFRGD